MTFRLQAQSRHDIRRANPFSQSHLKNFSRLSQTKFKTKHVADKLVLPWQDMTSFHIHLASIQTECIRAIFLSRPDAHLLTFSSKD